MSSIRDQLLKAGLVTEEQVKQAESEPKKSKKNKPSKSQPKQRTGSAQNKSRSNNKKRELTDLERFYQEREKTDKAEQAEQEKQRKEAARIRKEKRAKIGSLIKSNMVNVESAEHRYNFVVGSSVKYLFVTEEQQEKLARGKLAIVFLGEKRCLIPTEIGNQIKAIEPSRLVIFCEPDSE